MIRHHALALSAAWLIAFASLAGCGSEVTGGGGNDDPCGVGENAAIDCFPVCEYGGTTHQVGDSFPALDGCNTCTCQEDSSVACTELACADGCEYGGQFFMTGESFPAGDGCNSCTCLDDGSVACTDMACVCDPAAEWWRDYVGMSPEECAVIDFGCPPNTVGFENACGCGCEQSKDCPQFFDCMPPKTCDVEKLKEQCPYSQIAF